MQNQSEQSVEQTPPTNHSKLGDVSQGLKTAWLATGPYRVAAAAAVITGAVSIHFFNNESEVIKNVYNDNELQITHIDQDTSIITRGNSSSIRYKGVTCPIILSWPEQVELSLGNTGDATLNPSEDNISIDTILGTLGVTRDVQISKRPVDNAEGLMKDFYAYTSACYERIERLQAQDGGPTNALAATDLNTAPAPE